MRLHTLQSATKRKKKKIIGRGGKRGTYSGRGIKGQKARAGRKIRPELRDLIKKIPKKRGYRFTSITQKPAIVKLGRVGEVFLPQDVVTPEALCEKGLVAKRKNRIPRVKILSDGDITHALTISGCLISQKAKEKIEKAGGIVSPLL